MGKEMFCSLYPFTAKSHQDMNSCFTTFSAQFMIWQNYLYNLIAYNYLQQNLTHLYVWFCQNHWINYFISFHGQRSVLLALSFYRQESSRHEFLSFTTFWAQLMIWQNYLNNWSLAIFYSKIWPIYMSENHWFNYFISFHGQRSFLLALSF